jgi:putative Mg2+ transporter-C (MgtC) family protein
MEAVLADLRSGMQLPLEVVAARLAGAALFCALIGLEREASDHPAGLRTNMLVGLASAAFAIVTVHLVESYTGQGDAVRLDPIRLVEAVTSGVAFLAAGLIIFSRGRVKGLTTGALMWASAAVGVAVGLGLWQLGAIVLLLALVIGAVLKSVSNRIGGG